MSLLMFPARGTVARLLVPRVASAVAGSDTASGEVLALRAIPMLGLRYGTFMVEYLVEPS
jgi:hypothetical protein